MAGRYRFLRFADFKDKAVTLSYDDGVRDDIQLVSIMNEYGLKGTFNINSGMFGDGNGSRLSPDEAKKLYLSGGHEVAVHGKQHLSLADITPEAAVNDVLSDRIALEKLTGGIVKGMAYANGSYNDEVVGILKNCGIKYSRTVISTERFDIPNDWLRLPATCHHNNPNLSRLVENFLAPAGGYNWSKTPKLFYLWGHSYEYPRDNNWSVIENFAKTVGRRDDIWYATNVEIYDYVQAYNRLEFDVEYSRVYNPTDKDVWLNINDKEILAEKGKTTEIK